MSKEKTVLVCVTPQESSRDLVKAGRTIANQSKVNLEVVSVLPVEKKENPIDPQTLEMIYATAKEQGGEMAVYFSDDPTYTVIAHIAKRKPLTIVVGFPGAKSNNFISMIHLLLPETPISMVDKNGTVYNILPQEKEINFKV